MPEPDPRDHEHLVRELAAAYGVATDYWDWQGQHVLASAGTRPEPLSPRGTTRRGGGCCRRCW